MGALGGIGGGLVGNHLANKYNQKFHSPKSSIVRQARDIVNDENMIKSLTRQDLNVFEDNFGKFVTDMKDTYGKSFVPKGQIKMLPERITALMDGVQHRDALRMDFEDALKSKARAITEFGEIKNKLQASAKKIKTMGIGGGIGAGLVGGALLGAIISKMMKKRDSNEQKT